MKARRCILILVAAMLASCATVPVWKDGAFETSEAVLRKDIKLIARLPNVPNGTKATITIIEQTTQKETPLSYQIESVVKGGKVKAVWNVKYDVGDEDVLGFGNSYEQPSYAFYVECDGEKSEMSKSVKLFTDFYMELSFQGRLLTNYPYVLKLADGSYRKGKTNKNGMIVEKKIPVGKVVRF